MQSLSKNNTIESIIRNMWSMTQVADYGCIRITVVYMKYVALRYLFFTETQGIFVITNFQYSPLNTICLHLQKIFNIISVYWSAAIIPKTKTKWQGAFKISKFHTSYNRLILIIKSEPVQEAKS